MKNNYEASEVFEFGKANEVVLGSKPQSVQVDAILGPHFRTQQLPDDIDESDE
ncbi:MAG TPA: hypothetical protein VF088_21350 [Pyrinomonadaceae bacterium]